MVKRLLDDPHVILDGFESLRRHHLAKQSLRESQLTKIPLSAGARVLDIAVGPGLYLDFWLRHTAAKKVHFTLFEHSAEALELCAKEAEKSGARSRVELVRGDMFQLGKHLSQPFDAIFIGNTLEYIADPVAYLRDQLLPLLKPSGVLAIRDLDCGYVNCNLVDPALNHKVVGARIRNCQATKEFHNPFLGRDMKRMFRETGLKNISHSPNLVEFSSPLTSDQANYLSRIHTTWYGEDALGILSPEDLATWKELFSLENPDTILAHPDFYYTEMEFLTLGTK